MTYEEMMKALIEDPAYASKITRDDILAVEIDEPEERVAMLNRWTLVRTKVRTYNDTTICHPQWQADVSISQWAIELLNTTIVELKKQPWCEFMVIPLGALWTFNQSGPLLPHYQIWYKGDQVPIYWE